MWYNVCDCSRTKGGVYNNDIIIDAEAFLCLHSLINKTSSVVFYAIILGCINPGPSMTFNSRPISCQDNRLC